MKISKRLFLSSKADNFTRNFEEINVFWPDIVVLGSNYTDLNYMVYINQGKKHEGEERDRSRRKGREGEGEEGAGGREREREGGERDRRERRGTEAGGRGRGVGELNFTMPKKTC